jgi:hypothetical protein
LIPGVIDPKSNFESALLQRRVSCEPDFLLWSLARSKSRRRASRRTWLLVPPPHPGWKKFGKPFIQQAWPRERKFQTSTSSRNFAHLAEEAGDHFPDVVKTVLPLLGPVDHVDMLIYGGTRDGNALASRFPEAMLALPRAASPSRANNCRFQPLEALATTAMTEMKWGHSPAFCKQKRTNR